MSRIAELLGELHLLLGEDLVKLIRNGSATSADRSVARQFLKDHNIDVPRTDPHLAALAAAASFHDEDDAPPRHTH
jgi:hypothetical protein